MLTVAGQHRARVQKQAVPTLGASSLSSSSFEVYAGKKINPGNGQLMKRARVTWKAWDWTAIQTRRRGVSTSTSGMSCPRPQIAGRRVLQPVSGDDRDEPEGDRSKSNVYDWFGGRQDARRQLSKWIMQGSQLAKRRQMSAHKL